MLTHHKCILIKRGQWKEWKVLCLLWQTRIIKNLCGFALIPVNRIISQVSAETLRERHTPMCKPGSQRILHGSYTYPGISNPRQRLLHAEDRTGATIGDHMITQDRGLFVLQAVGRLGHRRTSAGAQFPDTKPTPWLIYETENGFLKHINTDIIGSTHKQDGETKHCSIN